MTTYKLGLLLLLALGSPSCLPRSSISTIHSTQFEVPPSSSCASFSLPSDLDEIADFLHNSWRADAPYLSRIKPVLDLRGSPFPDFATYRAAMGWPLSKDSSPYLEGVTLKDKPILYEDIKALEARALGPNNRKETCLAAQDFVRGFVTSKVTAESLNSYAPTVIQMVHTANFQRDSKGRDPLNLKLPSRFQLLNAEISNKLWRKYRQKWLSENQSIAQYGAEIDKSFDTELNRAKQLIKKEALSKTYDQFLWSLSEERTGATVFNNEIMAEVARNFLDKLPLSSQKAPGNITNLNEVAAGLSAKAASSRGGDKALSAFLESTLLAPLRTKLKLGKDAFPDVRLPNVTPGSGALVASLNFNQNSAKLFLKMQPGNRGGLEEVIMVQTSELVLRPIFGASPIDGKTDLGESIAVGRIVAGKQQSPAEVFAIASARAPGISVEEWIAEASTTNPTNPASNDAARAEMGSKIGSFMRNMHSRMRKPQSSERATGSAERRADMLSNAAFEFFAFQKRVLGSSSELRSASAKNLGSMAAIKETPNLNSFGRLRELEDKLKVIYAEALTQFSNGNVEPGYSHGDFHTGNLFVDLSSGIADFTLIDYGSLFWSMRGSDQPGVGDQMQDVGHFLAGSLAEMIRTSDDNPWSDSQSNKSENQNSWQIRFLKNLASDYFSDSNSDSNRQWKRALFYVSRYIAFQLHDTRLPNPVRFKCATTRKRCSGDILASEILAAWAEILNWEYRNDRIQQLP